MLAIYCIGGVMKITKEKITSLILEEIKEEFQFGRSREEQKKRKMQDVKEIVNIMTTKLQATEVEGLLRILERDYGHATGTGDGT